MAEQKQQKVNPLIAGAVLVGAAAAAVALSKKGNREKAGKVIQDLTKKGERIARKPEVKAIAGAAVTKAAEALGEAGSSTKKTTRT
jgi:hypothetical protein